MQLLQFWCSLTLTSATIPTGPTDQPLPVPAVLRFYGITLRSRRALLPLMYGNGQTFIFHLLGVAVCFMDDEWSYAKHVAKFGEPYFLPEWRNTLPLDSSTFLHSRRFTWPPHGLCYHRILLAANAIQFLRPPNQPCRCETPPGQRFTTQASGLRLRGAAVRWRIRTFLPLWRFRSMGHHPTPPPPNVHFPWHLQPSLCRSSRTVPPGSTVGFRHSVTDIN